MTLKVPRLVFRSSVSKQGGRLKVNIPKAVIDLAEYMIGKDIKVTLEVVEEKKA
jgi:antitoxin component of MazEF toxin-antitoxin module